MGHLGIRDPVGHHNVSHCMSSREHVLDLLTGLDIPLRHIVFPHEIFLFFRQPFPFTDFFHDGERVLVRHTF